MMKAAKLFVRCLENEGVNLIFGIPGEENLDVMDALLDSHIRFITTRHEQGAAFMADVYGRLTGRAGVCLATLGPGATNLITGVADANMDRAPIIAIAGQAATTRLHKESHQVLELVQMFSPITKYASQILEPEIIPEVVRKAFKVSQTEKPGASFISLPENVADMNAGGRLPLPIMQPALAHPSKDKVVEAAEVIRGAKRPIIMAGNGIIRAGASDQLIAFAEKLHISVATTFMAKGVIPFSHPLCMGAVGLQSRDYVACGFDRADLIICIGYDMVEYPPALWNGQKGSTIIHIDSSPAEVDEYYPVDVGVVGDVGAALSSLTRQLDVRELHSISSLRKKVLQEMGEYADDAGFPLKPQKIIWDLRAVLASEDIVISDVGAHKMWMARMYQAERPNTCIISNGFASMGIALPGAIAAKLAYPDRAAIAVTGDAGFMMNSQEIETALRIGTSIVILIWHDSAYGLIEWKQMNRFGRPSNIKFGNPDFVKYAKSFGASGYQIDSAADLAPVLKQAIADDTVVVIDCPVDYSENLKLTEKLVELVCPI